MIRSLIPLVATENSCAQQERTGEKQEAKERWEREHKSDELEEEENIANNWMN